MTTELLRIDNDITWLRTTIRRRAFGIESDFHFSTTDGLLSVAIDTLANWQFLHEVIETDCLAICEHPAHECGWTEHGRYEVRINDRSDVGFAAIRGSFVRWGPIQNVPN